MTRSRSNSSPRPLILALAVLFCLAGCREEPSKSTVDASKKEPTRPAGEPPKPQPLNMEEADTDGSGDLSEEEFLAYHAVRMKRFFASLDKNGDGKLSGEEMARIQRGPSAGARPVPVRQRPSEPVTPPEKGN